MKSAIYPSQNPAAHPISDPCPCCGQVALESYVQCSLGSQPTQTKTHCKNPACAMFTMTLTHETFMQQAAESRCTDEIP